MAIRCQVCLTQSLSPYENLALEEYLLMRTPEDVCMLYLWQNQRTVVIGRNQNAWKECNVAMLEQDGGHLARRLSGGGAVYHDLGNLNFTFLTRRAHYDVARQLDVILCAVRMLGLQAEKTGRNDLTIDGRKFSGNAFYQAGDHAYHHGTLLVDVEMDAMAHYLNVSATKLAAKGISSVRARVANLHALNAEVTIPRLREAMVDAFGRVYGQSVTLLSCPPVDTALQTLRERYASWDFRMGHSLPFTWKDSARFAWGECTLALEIVKGRIVHAAAYSDAMDAQAIANIPAWLTDCLFAPEQLATALRPLREHDGNLYADVYALLRRGCGG
ncbi:MAG: lipoate--protein ligase [Clostridia bacterium]